MSGTSTHPTPSSGWRLPLWALPNELASLDGWPAGKRTPRDWLADAALFAVAVAVYATSYVDTAIDPDPQYVAAVPEWIRTVDPWVGVAACLALWFRRRFPLALAIALIPVMIVSSTAYGAVLIGILTVAIHRGWIPASAIAAVIAALSALFAMTWHPPEMTFRSFLATIVVLTALPLSWGLVVRFRRELLASLRRDAQRQREEHERRLAETRRAERQRIAWEMHDVLAHRISLLSVHAGALSYRTSDGAGEPPTATEIREATEVIRDNAHRALDELGQVLSVLRHDDGGEERTALPTFSDLPHLVDEARAAGQQVELSVELPDDGSRPGLHEQRTAYRVVQEGLTNARKHAPGSPVRVRIAGDPGRRVLAEVTNPVPVAATSATSPETPGAGTGLTGLRERVEVDGGTLASTRTDGVFRLAAELPWR